MPALQTIGLAYFVPSESLAGAEAARELGIRGEQDLFGGIVPTPSLRPKAITHPLVTPDAYAPAGWCHEFARRVREAVLPGFCAFTLEDARRAGARLLEHRPAHQARARGRRARAGRHRPSRRAGGALDAMNTAELSSYGARARGEPH